MLSFCWIVSPESHLALEPPHFAPEPKEAVSEHLALAFEFDLAHGVLVVGFLWDACSILALTLVYRSLFQ